MLPTKTSGQRLHAFDTDGVIITETLHRADLRLPRHCHENANITLVLGGGFEEVVQKTAYDCAPSTALLKPAGAEHLNRYGRYEAHCLIVEFGPTFLRNFPEGAALLAEATCWRSASVGLLGFQMLREVCAPDSTSAIVLEGLALQLLGQTARCRGISEHSGQPPGWLSRARDFVSANFATDLRLSDVAGIAGVHAVHLNKSFNRYFGITVGSYIRQLRLEFAVQLLTKSDLSLSTIAAETGFCDQSHFTNVFRRHMRCAPGWFREIQRLSEPQD